MIARYATATLSLMILAGCAGPGELTLPMAGPLGAQLPVTTLVPPVIPIELDPVYPALRLEPPGPARQPGRADLCIVIDRPDRVFTTEWAVAAVTEGTRQFDIDRGSYRYIYYHMQYVGEAD